MSLIASISDTLASECRRTSWQDTALKTVVTRAGSLQSFTTKVAHVLPVSDDGGSTAEIVRVLGGPAVGDIRSRCLRLADASNVEVARLWHVLALCTVVQRDLT